MNFKFKISNCIVSVTIWFEYLSYNCIELKHIIMTEFEIYLLTRLDYLQGFIIGIAIVLGVVLGFWCLWLTMEGNWDDEDEKKPKKRYFVALISFVFIACLIPTKNEAIVIFAGGKAFDYLEKDKNLQEIPHKATEIFSKYLDTKIKELDSVSKK